MGPKQSPAESGNRSIHRPCRFVLLLRLEDLSVSNSDMVGTCPGCTREKAALRTVLAVQQSLKKGSHFSGADVPGAVANGVLADLALRKRVVGKRFLNQRDELVGRAVNLQAWRLQIFVKRRNDHGLASGEVFADLDGASVAGERVLLNPGQHTNVDVIVITWKLRVGF